MFKRSLFVFLCLLIPGVVGSATAQTDESLIGWWKFDEGVGTTAADSSGNGRDIELVSATWEEGFAGSAVHFHGAGYGRDREFSSTANAITVCAWVWHEAFVANRVERYVTVGPEIAVIRKETDGRLHFYITPGGAFSHAYAGDVLVEGQWLHVAGTWDGAAQRLYLNGEEVATLTPSGVLGTGTMFRLSSPDGEPLNGMLDEVRVYDRALSGQEITAVMNPGGLVKAGKPVPADKAADVPRDVTLGWTPGESAVTHDVYFGTSFDDVNAAGRSNPLEVLLGQDQPDATFDPPGILDFETTYYWRVDEVNGAPDFTIFKGDVWSFTTEPFAYAIANIVATTNGNSDAGAGPENTVNGSGLNTADQHSTSSGDMWLALPGDEPLWIQWEFDGLYKLHEMLVWNYNVQFELILGFGLKDVTIEYSENGADWTALGDATLNRATASPTYAANTTVDLQGVAARSVRMTVHSGYGMMGQYGLSEVRFMYIPTQARQPQPADGATDVSVESTLVWRAGREAVSHEVYFGTDAAALALVDTVSTSGYTPDELNLGATYYWQINEIQETESWQGPVWSFATQEYIVVDDFESYNDDLDAGTTIFDTWLDGWVNDTGSTVGHLDAPFAERTIVHGGEQSMPLSYDNTSVAVSEADLELSANWSRHGIRSLSLYFYGADGNTGQLYVKINGTKIAYDGPAINLTRPSWQLWSIDLSQAGNVSNVRSLTIGVEGAGAKGVVYIDDVRLYPEVLAYTSPDVTGAGDAVQGVPNDADWPAAETPNLAIDDNVDTKFLHFKGVTEPTGIRVTPLVGPTVVTGLTLTSANDAPERDPVAFELYGSNETIDGPYTLIADGDVVDFAGATAWPRLTKTTTPIEFANTVAYAYYQLLFPAVRTPASANSMQIAEIELLGAVAP